MPRVGELYNSKHEGFNLDGVGTFPFGWVREPGGENWQIIWDQKTRVLFAKGAKSKEVLEIGTLSTWIEAKAFAGEVMENPGRYLSRPAGKAV